jgi:hypothetical protein
MHTPAAATIAPAPGAAQPPYRGYITCLSTALAALMGRAAVAELSEDELLGELRKEGLTTYLSPQLARWLERPPGRLSVQLLGAEPIGLLWWLLVRLQGPSSPHRLGARLSGALAEELAGPNLPNTECP